jgi:glycosyltransferase A (GT-A) superfamily protein (DUF2064 family)
MIRNLLYLTGIIKQLHSQNNDTAILLFTRTAGEEALCKDFTGTGNFRVNKLVAEHLLSHTQKTIRKSGLPFFVIDSAHQIGSSFGERIANALDEIFQCGINKVIIIGNDCPCLSATTLHAAHQILLKGKNVLGRDLHGGAYLIGLSKASFNKQQFVHLPWVSSQIFNALCNYLGQVKLLETKIDLNKTSDILSYLKKHTANTLSKFLYALLSSFNTPVSRALTTLRTYTIRFFFPLKAPPFAC